MEKDIGKISKNNDTDIMIRVDDFGGKIGLTIREFVKGERYTGFTKAGTRIPAEKFAEFKKLINSINEKDLVAAESSSGHLEEKQETKHSSGKEAGDKKSKTSDEEIEDQEF